MKIAAGIEYCGTRYCGWQAQSHAPSVQELVEQALSRVADHPVRVFCAGRTDTGVHALQQVIHFETQSRRTPRSWVLGCNVNLPPDISVLWASEVRGEFHARYSATARCYRYLILNRAARPGMNTGLVTWEYRPLDVERMSTAAGALIGEHDFTSFRAVACQAQTPVRRIHRLQLNRSHDYVIMEIEANAFLHHMVRNIAGVLMAVGMGREEPGWVTTLLAARDRTLGGVTAPAAGLYLVRVVYPDEFGLPSAVPTGPGLPELQAWGGWWKHSAADQD